MFFKLCFRWAHRHLRHALVCPPLEKVVLREPGNLGSPQQIGQLTLEGEPQPELQLPGRAERVDACSYPNAVNVVAQTSSAVDLTGGSRQQSIERGPR